MDKREGRVCRGYTYLEHCVVFHPTYTDKQKVYALGRNIECIKNHHDYAIKTHRTPTETGAIITIEGNNPSSRLPWSLVYEKEGGVLPGKGLRHSSGFSIRKSRKISNFDNNPQTEIKKRIKLAEIKAKSFGALSPRKEKAVNGLLNNSVLALPRKNEGGLQGGLRLKNGNFKHLPQHVRERKVIETKRSRRRMGTGMDMRGYTWLEHCISYHPLYTDTQKAYAMGRSINSVMGHRQYVRKIHIDSPTVEEITSVMRGETTYACSAWLVVYEEKSGKKPGKGISHAKGYLTEIKDMAAFKNNPFSQSFSDVTKRLNNVKSKTRIHC